VLADILVNFGGTIHISGMTKLELSNFVHKEIISSLAKDD